MVFVGAALNQLDAVVLVPWIPRDGWVKFDWRAWQTVFRIGFQSSLFRSDFHASNKSCANNYKAEFKMRFILLALVGPVLVGAVPFWQPVVDGYQQVKRAFSRVSFGRGDGDGHAMVRDGIEDSDQDIFDPNKGCCAGYKRGDYLANITFVTGGFAA